jgi:hypothetical protein
MEYGVIIMFAGFFLMLEMFDSVKLIKNKEKLKLYKDKKTFKIELEENNVKKESKFDACS